MGDLPGFDGALLPALLAAAAAAVIVAALVPSAPRLAPRLRPYNSPNRVRLGKPADLQAATHGQTTLSGGALAALFAPLLRALLQPLTRLVTRDGDDALAAQLLHAGVYPDLPAGQRVAAWRRRQLAAAAALGGTLALAVITRSGLLAVAAPLGAHVFGVVLPKTRLERLTDARRERIRTEPVHRQPAAGDVPAQRRRSGLRPRVTLRNDHRRLHPAAATHAWWPSAAGSALGSRTQPNIPPRSSSAPRANAT